MYTSFGASLFVFTEQCFDCGAKILFIKYLALQSQITLLAHRFSVIWVLCRTEKHIVSCITKNTDKTTTT